MLEKLNEEDLRFMETFYYPIATAECLFSDFDNLTLMQGEKFADLRLGQYPLLSHEYIIDNLPFKELPQQERDKANFNLRKGAGDIYCLGGRLFGKTLIVEKVDLLVSMALLEVERVGLSSYDAIHIRGVLEDVFVALDQHPFFQLFKPTLTRSPNYRVQLKTGYNLESINMNLAAKNPGCFDDQTEILTDSGWKLFKDLSYDNKVLSGDKNNLNVDFCDIEKIHEYDYCGKMKKLSSRTSEFLVTPNHNLLCINNKKIDFEEVQNITKKQIYCPSTYQYSGHSDDVILEGIVNGQRKKFVYKLEDWVKFIAFYLSEGSAYKIKNSPKYMISIGQKNNNEYFEKILESLNIHATKNIDKYGFTRYSIHHKLIAKHLISVFGTKKEKKISKYIKTADSKIAKNFIEAYLLADGNTYLQNDKHVAQCVFTTLVELADDLQLVAQNAGYKTHLKKKRQKTHINNRHYDIEIFIIQLCLSKNSVFKKDLIEDVDYNGKVYCVTTNPHHTVFVRRNGCVMWSGNSQFFQKHLTRLYIEEASMETDQIFQIRRDSVAELGCVFRIAGMTNFTRHSPCGMAYNDLTLQNKICNLPQYVNPRWDAQAKKKAVKDFGGEQSVGYRVFIRGEVVEDGVSVFDMERVRKCYDNDKHIKVFEVTKKNFHNFKDNVVVERPKNASNILIFGDIGESAPTELGIVYEVNNLYKYMYNITLYNLTDKQQFKFIRWLANKISANYISIDCTDGTGRAIFRSLEEVFPKENLIWCGFNEKIPVDFEKDEQGNPLRKGGDFIYKEEYISEWSIKRLKDIFYDQRILIPVDHKFDVQMNSVVAMQSGARTIYKCVSKEDHLFQAFQVFAILQWNIEFGLAKPIQESNFFKGGV